MQSAEKRIEDRRFWIEDWQNTLPLLYRSVGWKINPKLFLNPK
jgi:hypothetical protein